MDTWINFAVDVEAVSTAKVKELKIVFWQKTSLG